MRGKNLLYRRNPGRLSNRDSKAEGKEEGEGKEEEEEEFHIISLANNGMAKMNEGDEVRIETPGGGGWGKVE